MADISYRVDSLYRMAFPDLASKVFTKLDGVRDLAVGQVDKVLGNGFQVETEAQTSAPKYDFSGIDTTMLVQGEEQSYLGTPIFQPINFLGGVYQVLGNGAQQGQVVDESYAGWQLPATATAEFRRNKVITKSRPSTANGSTKELWAFEDWDITIRGLILDAQPNFFPEGQLRQMLRWEKITDGIDVAGDMFTYLGIKRLVIENFNIGRVAGQPNVIPFQMSCVSDEPLELSILSNPS